MNDFYEVSKENPGLCEKAILYFQIFKLVHCQIIISLPAENRAILRLAGIRNPNYYFEEPVVH